MHRHRGDPLTALFEAVADAGADAESLESRALTVEARVRRGVIHDERLACVVVSLPLPTRK